MSKKVNITLDYYPVGGKNTVSGKQLFLIEKLFEEKGFPEAYNKYLTKNGCRNPFNRITKANASNLITALMAGDEVIFLEKG